MIDCLYNITAMLDNPARGFQFRASGYKKALEVLESDTHRYKGNAKWDAYNAKQRSLLDRLIKIDGFTLVDIQAATIWPTLGRYLRPASKGAPLTPHQQFLKKLTHGFWQEYSAVAHGTYDGILPIAVFFVPKDLPHDERARVDEFYERMIFMHISRVAAILLCMLTEVQAYFKFDGANINERLHKIWDVIVAAPEVKELYEERYEKLMTKI
jgi:hypothetical protein